MSKLMLEHSRSVIDTPEPLPAWYHIGSLPIFTDREPIESYPMKKALAFVVILFTFQSCNQENLSITDMLTQDDWKLETLTVDPAVIVNNVAITNYYSQLYDYDKDNTIRFRTDGIMITDEGPLKGNPNDPQTLSVNWLLSASEDMITAWNETDTVVYGIPHLAEDHLTLTYSQRDTATQINYTFTAGFVH